MASNSSSPEPPVPLENACSIIYDNVLYVYSPNAFQTLPLTQNATWTQEQNGVSVTGGLCVMGGIDGNSDNPALYIVGGTTNSSVTNYSGIQRYSLSDKSWATINPITAVTANRVNHGATYLNASSAILVYGGDQNGVEADSTETFLMLMYPPYRVQAYSSAAPPVIRPFVLPWSDSMAVMVGGGTSNQKIFTFHPTPGWVDLGLALPQPMPDTSAAQCALQMLDDGSKILETFDLSASPNVITRNVLLGPGGNLATYGQTVGDDSASSASTAASAAPSSRIVRKRQASLNSYPTYNDTNAPTVTRSNFALATGNSNLIAAVGGDSQDSINVFDQSANSWLADQAVFGAPQIPLTSSSSSSSQIPTATATTPPAASSSAAAGDGGSQTNGLAILGGVLGGICGLAAVLIIILLYLRSIKRKRAMDAAKKQQGSPYPDDKPKKGNSFEEGGMQPLSAQAQPMGRSPVSSTIIDDPARDSVAMFSGKFNEKATEAGIGPHGSSKLSHQRNASGSMSSNFFKKEKEKSPLQISRPMLPDLGDYQARPSIDLGKATPAVPVAHVIAPVAAATAVAAERKADQRRTDEGWAQYFTEDKDSASDTRPNSRPSTAKGGGGGFWPGSGVPQQKSNRSTKLPLRDSAGNLLNNLTVNTSNPSEVAGQDHSRLQPRSAVISRAESLSTSHSSDDDDGYEDDHIDGYSSGIPESFHDNHAWTPVGNTWSGPAQRPVRVPSVSIGASAFPPPTGLSENTTNTSTSGSSGIPAFPLSHASMQKVGPQSNTGFAGISTVQLPIAAHFASTTSHSRKSSANGVHGGPAVQDYFGPGPVEVQHDGRIPANTDTSWVDLGTPARGRFSKVLYQFLLDDVARKQIKPTAVKKKGESVEYFEDRRGNSNNINIIKNKASLIRTLSSKGDKQRKQESMQMHKIQKALREADDNSLPSSPAFPAEGFGAQIIKFTPDPSSSKDDSKRLTF